MGRVEAGELIFYHGAPLPGGSTVHADEAVNQKGGRCPRKVKLKGLSVVGFRDEAGKPKHDEIVAKGKTAHAASKEDVCRTDLLLEYGSFAAQSDDANPGGQDVEHKDISNSLHNR